MQTRNITPERIATAKMVCPVCSNLRIQKDPQEVYELLYREGRRQDEALLENGKNTGVGQKMILELRSETPPTDALLEVGTAFNSLIEIHQDRRDFREEEPFFGSNWRMMSESTALTIRTWPGSELL